MRRAKGRGSSGYPMRAAHATLGQHVQHVKSKRNAFVNGDDGEKMNFWFPDTGANEGRWAHMFEKASDLVLDLRTCRHACDEDRPYEGRLRWKGDDGQWRWIGSRGDVQIEDASCLRTEGQG